MEGIKVKKFKLFCFLLVFVLPVRVLFGTVTAAQEIYDDFNDSDFNQYDWTAIINYPAGKDPLALGWIKEQNQRLEFNIPREGYNTAATVTSVDTFTGAGEYEVEFQNGYSYNYLYKSFILMGMYKGKMYSTGITFSDYGVIRWGVGIHKDGVPEQTEWGYLYSGNDAKWWNWLFYIKLKRNADGTITITIKDDHGHNFVADSMMTIPHEVPLQIRLNVELWKYGRPTLVWFDNVKVTTPNQSPVANAGDDQTLIVGETAQFDGSDSHDPDGTIESYIWNFGDGSETVEGISVTHNFSEAGIYNVTLNVIDNNGAEDTDDVIITVNTVSQALQNDIIYIRNLMDVNPYPPLVDKLEDVIMKLESSVEEMGKIPSDSQAAIGNIEGAVGDLEAAIKDQFIEFEEALKIMNEKVDIARQMALNAINDAISNYGDLNEIFEAKEYLFQADQLRESKLFKDAVSNYKDALCKAESAMN